MSNWFVIQKLNQYVYGFSEPKHFEEVMSYLIVGDNEALLWDTGMGIDNIRKNVEQITDKPIRVVNSHTHFDHVGGNHLFNTSYIFNSEFAIRNATNGFSNVFLKGDITPDSFFKVPHNFNHKQFNIPKFSYITLQNNQEIKIDPFVFRVIHTPGHSPDSICLYEESQRWLFSGDTLYNGPIYIQMEESNLEDYYQSILILSELESEQIFAGHNEFMFDPKWIESILDALIERGSATEIKLGERLRLLLKRS